MHLAPSSAVSQHITGWSAVSPFGLDSDDFRRGLFDGRATHRPVDRERWEVADDEASIVPDFDARAVLGRKGTRSMDRVTALAVTATGRLLAGDRSPRTGPDAARPASTLTSGSALTSGSGLAAGSAARDAGFGTGLVLGTSIGSAQSMMDFTRSSLVAEKPFYVDPAQMPNAVMNCAAGQCAIWYQIKGPNATIAGGRNPVGLCKSAG